jgi:hypothetical protein
MKELLMLSLLLSTSVFAEVWDADNDPRKFDKNFEYKLNALPLKAVLPLNKTPWSNSYWPRFKGGINYRWNTPNPIGNDLNSPSRSRVRTMSWQQLSELSPAEKFDLAQGHYDYPLSTRVEKQFKKNAKDYEGLCDGWTASAIQFPEPAPVDITNPDGIVIPFGSSDVKALMSYDVSINFQPGAMKSVFIGGYCGFGIGMNSAKCSDINPGAFHVVLANQIALKQEAFAADIEARKETWNQPVYGYEFEILGKTTAEGAAQAYIVHAKMMYAEDDPDGEEYKHIFNWNAVVGTVNFMGSVQELDYVLELDYAGNIIGGSWLGESKRNHPDLFWKPTKKIQFTSGFNFLNKIYKPFFVE